MITLKKNETNTFLIYKNLMRFYSPADTLVKVINVETDKETVINPVATELDYAWKFTLLPVSSLKGSDFNIQFINTLASGEYVFIDYVHEGYVYDMSNITTEIIYSERVQYV